MIDQSREKAEAELMAMTEDICASPWQADNRLKCQLPRDHANMHWSKGTWDTGGEVEIWWNGPTGEELEES